MVIKASKGLTTLRGITPTLWLISRMAPVYWKKMDESKNDQSLLHNIASFITDHQSPGLGLSA